MYIPEFWCGVAAVILLEVAALIAFVVYHQQHRRK